MSRDAVDRTSVSNRSCADLPPPSPAAAPRGGCGFEFGEVRRGVDDRNVGESLREVPELPFTDRIVFLRQQTEIVSERKQALEQRDRIIAAANQCQAVGEPEAAGEKNAFTGW